MKFVQTKGDPCLYVSTDGAETIIIAVYVDNILIGGKTDKRIAEVKIAIAEWFEVKDMGKLHYFLGVKVVQDLNASTVWLGQLAYSDNIILQFNMQNAKTCRTPVNPSLKLSKSTEESTHVDQELYQSAVGKLLYLSTWRRPHILRYIAGTVNFGLMFTRSGSADCIGFSDADWACDIDDRKSTSGYLFQVGGASISWKNKKQLCDALSTAEAEYMSPTLAVQEAIWLNRLLAELQIQKEPSKPALIYEDNQSAICMAKNPQFNGRSKHIAIKYHFIRDETKKGSYYRCAVLQD